MSRRSGFQFIVIFVGLCSALTLHAEEGNLARGERLFNAHCAICDSVGGTGGRGPTLTVPTFRRAANDAALARIIDNGITGTEMPGTWAINDDETRQIVGYVRSLARVEKVNLPGDPERGKAIYEATDCASCHIVSGKGRGIGPELTDIGRRRSPAYLSRSIVQPAADTPESFLLILAVSDSGEPVEGMRVNEDSFTVQLRDIEGTLHSLRKGELKTYRKLFGRTIMPNYAQKLSRAEIDDLVAYLAGLRGEQ